MKDLLERTREQGQPPGFVAWLSERLARTELDGDLAKYYVSEVLALMNEHPRAYQYWETSRQRADEQDIHWDRRTEVQQYPVPDPDREMPRGGGPEQRVYTPGQVLAMLAWYWHRKEKEDEIEKTGDA